MIVDSNQVFSKNHELLQDVCEFRSECVNFLLSLDPNRDEAELAYYNEELNIYKCYEV